MDTIVETELKKPHWKRTFSTTSEEGVRTRTMMAMEPVPDTSPQLFVRIWMEEVWKIGVEQDRVLLEDQARYWYQDREHAYATLERCWADALIAIKSGALQLYKMDEEGRAQETEHATQPIAQ